MSRNSGFTGMHWDTAEIRREREFGWFQQHEAELIEKARRQSLEAARQVESAEAEQRRLSHWRHCPHCGGEMASDRIEDIGVEKCHGCQGIFFDRGELETLLLHHDAHRRGFFRRLMGFPKD